MHIGKGDLTLRQPDQAISGHVMRCEEANLICSLETNFELFQRYVKAYSYCTLKKEPEHYYIVVYGAADCVAFFLFYLILNLRKLDQK